MEFTIIVIVVALIIGVALGRIKNASKLAAIKAEVEKLEKGITDFASTAILNIKAKL